VGVSDEFALIFQTLSLAATPPTNDVDSSLTTSATVTSELSVASSTSTAGANRMLRLSKRYKANSAVGAPATSAPEQGQGGQAKQARKQVGKRKKKNKLTITANVSYRKLGEVAWAAGF